MNTAMALALAYRKVETAEKFLGDIVKVTSSHEVPNSCDAFGRQQVLQLAWILAKPVIEDQIVRQKARIATLKRAGQNLKPGDLPMIEIHPDAYALRPFRIDEKRNRFIHYSATTFPADPRGGCQLYIMRAALYGPMLVDGDTPLNLDVLDREGSILQTMTLTTGGFEYLRRTLKFRVERDRPC